MILQKSFKYADLLNTFLIITNGETVTKQLITAAFFKEINTFIQQGCIKYICTKLQ